jgi:excinuclease ABC subunit C
LQQMIGASYFAARRRELRLDEIADAPNSPAVFLVWAEEGAPYLARTAMLQRRLGRLFRERDSPSRLLNLRGVARRIDYWLSGSQLESNALFYILARAHYPDQYLKIAKLRMPAYVKLTLANSFPRTQVTTRFTGGRACYFGPFRTRTAAEQFEGQALDLFQIRRCQENLEPRADHPGCIYGEMGMCLRPCQQVVGEAEYRSEVARMQQFLATGGASLLESAASARDRFSEELRFEDAARQHKRYERIEQVLALRDELVADASILWGVAVTPSSTPDAVTLWFMAEGMWADPIDFSLVQTGQNAVSLDQRLRERIAAIETRSPDSISERQEHLALLAKWFYSSWRDGEWLPFTSFENAPYRKIVNAISRVAKAASLFNG